MENGGYVEIASGASASFAANTFSDLVIGYGKSATVHSGTTAVDTVLDSSGELEVYSGGIVTGTTINAGGTLWINSGAIVNATTLNSGCSMWINSGKSINYTSVSAGAWLDISSGGTACGLEIAAGATVQFETNAVLNFDLTDRTTSDAALVNNLSLVSGNPTFSITVSTSQDEGVYALANGAAGFDKTVIICDTSCVCDSLTVGSTVTLSGQDYTLNLEAGSLTLTVGGAPVPGSVAGDLNGDGRADIIMTITEPGHGAEGATGAWLIQENQTAAWGDLSQRNPGWEIFGTGKTTAAKGTDDIYVRSTGNVIGAWTTNADGGVSGWETIGEFDSNTQIVGLGDFNADGQTDLLLRNTNGAVGCYFTSGETTGWNYFQSLGDEWKLCAVGDLNGDGRDDVVLKHDAGFAGSWLTQADGTMAWADLDTLSDGFSIVGAGDFNGDGTDDVLLKNGNYYGAWLVHDGNAAGWMGLGDLGDVTVEQIADFNGDGIDDLRIRTSAGDIGTQLVLGADHLDWHYYGSVGSEWTTALAAL